MPQDFLQWIVVILIALLFARDYLPAILSKWLGVKVGKEKEEYPNLDDIRASLEKFETNDLNHINDKLDKLIQNTDKELIYLSDIRDGLKK